jgi:hypothetical protein
MVINSTNINKMNNHLSWNTKNTTTYDVGNPGLTWDRHKNVVWLNQLMESQPSPLDNLINKG